MNRVFAILNFEHSGINEFSHDFKRFIESQDWLVVFIVILFVVILHISIRFIVKIVTKLANKTSNNIDNIILDHSVRPLKNYITLYGFYLITNILELPKEPIAFENIIIMILKILFILNTSWLFIGITNSVSEFLFKRAAKTSSKLDEQLLPIFQQTMSFFIYLMASVYTIQMMGYSISAIITGLGIGGLAVAMAAKDTLANLFGSIMIFIDRPFKMGDWIKINGDEGVVEEIGFRSTRIRTFSKTLISLPNSTIVMSSINNFSKMTKRRIKMTIGLTYDSPAKDIEGVVSDINSYLENSKLVHEEQILVYFTGFGPSSLDIFIYFFTKTTNWAKFLEAQQIINIDIMKIIEERGLSFAFPTQTLHIENDKIEDIKENIE